MGSYLCIHTNKEMSKINAMNSWNNGRNWGCKKGYLNVKGTVLPVEYLAGEVAHAWTTFTRQLACE